LAASLPNPFKYGPQSASVWTQKRREWVLRRMIESERLSVPGPDVDELDISEPIPPAEAEEPSND